MELGVTTAILFSLLAETLEAVLHYGRNFSEIFERLNRFYTRSVFLFFLSFTGYIYILFVSIKFDALNMAIVVALIIKIFDIFFKIFMIDEYQFLQNSILTKKEEEWDEDYELTVKFFYLTIPTWYYFTFPLIYPYLIWWALRY
jgi:hypothetical protein